MAYGRGGTQPTVTDADLLTGHLDPAGFLGGELTLTLSTVSEAIEDLGARLDLDAGRTAAGVIQVVTENMAAATRMHLSEKGRDPRGYTLMAYGGAGPVHAYALAKSLKLPRVIVPMGAGVLSAFGLLVADPAVEDVRGYPTPVDSADWARIGALYQAMESRATELLSRMGSGEEIVHTRSADMRYLGQGFEITVALPDGPPSSASAKELHRRFTDEYVAVFDRALPDGTPEVTNWRLTSTLPTPRPSLAHAEPEHAAEVTATSPPRGRRTVWLPGFGSCDCAVYDRHALDAGFVARGPAVFEEPETSCVIGPDCSAVIDTHHNLIIDIDYTNTDAR